MSKAGRTLSVGDFATTDFNGGRIATKVRIIDVDRSRKSASQSGILFKVWPLLKGGTADSWYDADWFDPVPDQLPLA